MSNIERALQERIKELTCLYEVSSIIVNANVELIEETLKAVALSLRKAFQFPNKTEIIIKSGTISISTKHFTENVSMIQSDIRIFNEISGQIRAYSSESEFQTATFLEEEQLLMDNVASKVGSLLERIEIQKNETSLKRQMERADRLVILGEITAGIAHELNTPLANILGFAELLKNDMESDRKAMSDLDKIIQNAVFSREVVKNLMFFACEIKASCK